MPTLNIINEEDLRGNFGEFSRKTRSKWYLRDNPSSDFSDVSTFQPKCNWKLPPGNFQLPPCVELFLCKLESELFSFLPDNPQAYSLTIEEWLAM